MGWIGSAAMTLTELVPSLEVCQRLKSAGFPQDTAMVWTGMATVTPNDMSGGWSHGGTVTPRYLAGRSDDVAAPTAGELEEWLMTKPLFSKRVASLHILYRGVKVQGEYVIHYFISALNGAGEEIGRVEALTLLAALAGLVLEVAR
jgi:hypothetical protein